MQVVSRPTFHQCSFNRYMEEVSRSFNSTVHWLLEGSYMASRSVRLLPLGLAFSTRRVLQRLRFCCISYRCVPGFGVSQKDLASNTEHQEKGVWLVRAMKRRIQYVLFTPTNRGSLSTNIHVHKTRQVDGYKYATHYLQIPVTVSVNLAKYVLPR